MTSNDEQSLVVWSDSTGCHARWASRIFGAILDETGSLGAGFPIADSCFLDTGEIRTTVRGASSGSIHLVVWANAYSDVRASRVTWDGVVLDPDGFVIGQGAHPVVAGGDSGFLVAWQRSDPLARAAPFVSTEVVQGVLVGRDGEVTAFRNALDTVREAPGVLSAPADWLLFNARRPGAAWNGRHFLVVAERDVRDSSACWPTSSWTMDCAVANSYEIKGIVIAQDGAVLDPRPVSIAAGNRGLERCAYPCGGPLTVAPAVAADSEEFLIAWNLVRSSSPSGIFGAYVSDLGLARDVQPVQLADRAARVGLPPSLVWMGTRYVVVWESYRHCCTDEIKAVTVDSAGNPGTQFDIAAPATRPAVAPLRDGAVVVYSAPEGVHVRFLASP